MAENLGRLSREIFLTKKRLNEINKNKEELYKKKKELREKILELRERLQELRQKRDQYTKEIDALMEDRAKTLEKIREIKEELRGLKIKKRSILKNKNIGQDVNKVRKELETLEYVLQTEVLSYAQERKIWNRIKYLRKILGKYEELSVVLADIDKKQTELDAYLSKLAIIRENIRRNIDERNKVKGEIRNIISELNTLREEYKNVVEEIKKYKEELKELNEKLKDLLERYVKALQSKRGREVQINIENVEEIVERYKEVQNKITNGEEINTEDILILQKYELLKSKGIIK